jgi:hypothetical protein
MSPGQQPLNPITKGSKHKVKAQSTKRKAQRPNAYWEKLLDGGD